MPRHLLLHIGLPKTGTTAIQRMLAARRVAFAAHGDLRAGQRRRPGAGIFCIAWRCIPAMRASARTPRR